MTFRVPLPEPVRLVAANEIRQAVRSKVLRIGFAMMLLVVAAVAAAPGLRQDDGMRVARVAVVRATASDVNSATLRVRFLEVTDRAVGTSLLRGSRVSAVVDGDVVLVRRSIDPELRAVLQRLRANQVLIERSQQAGLRPDQAAVVLRNVPPMQVFSTEVEEVDPASVTLATATQMLLFFSLTVFGSVVLSGVLQEKASRVVEVVLAAVTPRQLLTGKLIGIGLVGLAQVAVLAAVGLTVATTVSGTEIPTSTGPTMSIFVACFLLGFAFYAALFAAAGALVSRIEDSQAAATPISLLLTASYVLAVAVGLHPDGALARGLMFFPPTAPSIVVARMASGHPAWWELLLSAAVMVLAIVGVMRFAARVYNGAVLRVGARVKLREALRPS